MKPIIRKSILVFIFLIASITILCFYYFIARSPFNNEKTVLIQIYEGQSSLDVLNQIVEKGKVKAKNISALTMLFKVFKYENRVHPGQYAIKPGASAYHLTRQLISGIQTPVHLTFNNIRTIEDLAGRFSGQLMADSVDFLNSFRQTEWRDTLGLTAFNYMSIFIPDTYEVWWNITPDKLRSKFVHYWKLFWDEKRLKEASQIGLSPAEVTTLASIVEEETKKSDEMSKVAGLYLNRLRIGMPLQADPTVKFAVGDFSIRRILLEHIKVKSPYNTYLNIGLPPGPIRLPSIRTIDATLQPNMHSYLYMCAKEDFSGYHAFATTFDQHQKNAVKYRIALNKRGIMK